MIVVSVVIQVALFAAVLGLVVHFTLKMIRAQREIPSDPRERGISQAGAGGETTTHGP